MTALSDYLGRYARQHHESGGAKTFVAVAVDAPNTVLGHYTIAPGAIDFSDVPEAAERGLGRYEVPVFRLGRLAVSVNEQGRGLFLTLPVSWRGTVAQYAGRLHRLHDARRKVRVYDYADVDVPMLARMVDRRCRGYEAIGYTVMLPASAIPGWPADVTLPADPVWKRDYSGASTG